jgi:quinol-cytochrome oxidoreductase complex cytochrome b subunit/mono/diheme cytochrome c family protein
VFARLRTWLDNRTGYRRLVQALLLEHIPGGAKWRYVWGSCLAFVFALQVFTGILLMTAYSPGDTSAWGSVYFIQYEMEFGWLIRGLHHFGSQTMVVLLGIHMLQVVIAGAHLAPREVNWWLGLALMGLVLAMSLTGYLLPWDQKGFYATQVATNIAGSIPGIGSFLRTVIVGGPEYGNATLTRFYALHVGILPALIVLLLIAHVVLFRRHGVTAPRDAQGEGLFWPDQAFKDMVACMAIFGIMLGMVVWGGQGNPVDFAAFPRPAGEAQPGARPEPPAEPGLWDRVALGGREGRGANLDAPAVPGGSYPARPEWYFLFLFQLLKYFPNIVGTVLIPNGAGVLLFLLPLLGYGRLRPLGHVLAVIVVVGLLSAVGSLTCLALADDTVEELPRLLLTEVGNYVIPAVGGFFLVYLALLSILRRGGFRRAVALGGGLVLAVLLAGAGALLYAALSKQLPEPLQAFLQGRQEHFTSEEKEHEAEATKRARGFRHQLEVAEEEGKRAVVRAAAGIPAEGAALLVLRDPETQGPKLFKAHCATCHSYQYDPATGGDFFHDPPPRGKKEKSHFSAGDLAGFGTRDWIMGLLTDPDQPKYFGHTPFHAGPMSEYVSEAWGDDPAVLKKKDPKKYAAVKEKFERVAAWLATHPTTPAEDRGVWKTFKGECQKCHSFAGKGGGGAASRGPDLTGYGSQEWLRMMILDPHDPLRYGRTGGKRRTNAMPLFRDRERLTWPTQELHLERHRQALLQPLLEKAQKEAAEKAVSKVAEEVARDLSPDFARLVGYGAPGGVYPAVPQLVASGAVLALADDLGKRAAARLEDARAEVEIPAKVKAKIEARVAAATRVSQLTDVERELIIRWISRDYRVVFGGSPITGPKKR